MFEQRVLPVSEDVMLVWRLLAGTKSMTVMTHTAAEYPWSGGFDYLASAWRAGLSS